jgi:uncharacterized iron-regulated protein
MTTETQEMQEQVISYLADFKTDGIERKVYSVPTIFYDDHEGRDCGLTDKVIKRGKLITVVEMDYAGYQDLLTDADYYWDCRTEMDMVSKKIIRSAFSTLQSLQKQSAPQRNKVGA